MEPALQVDLGVYGVGESPSSSLPGPCRRPEANSPLRWPSGWKLGWLAEALAGWSQQSRLTWESMGSGKVLAPPCWAPATGPKHTHPSEGPLDGSWDGWGRRYLFYFFKRVIHNLFKRLYCFHNDTVFQFFRNRVFNSFCRKIAGIWHFHVVFQIIGGILALAPAHLFLQMLSNGSSLRWVFCYWINAPCYPGITLPAALGCCRQAIRTKGFPSLCTHRLYVPRCPPRLRWRNLSPEKRRGEGMGSRQKAGMALQERGISWGSCPFGVVREIRVAGVLCVP